MADPPSDDYEFARRVRQRAIGIRGELVDLLQADDPGDTASDLLPSIKTKGVTLSEVTFQLDRLAEEGRVVGEPGGVYRLP